MIHMKLKSMIDTTLDFAASHRNRPPLNAGGSGLISLLLVCAFNPRCPRRREQRFDLVRHTDERRVACIAADGVPQTAMEGDRAVGFA
jgi:hypothetical protein